MSSQVVGQLMIELGANVARLESNMAEGKNIVERNTKDMTAAVETFKSVLETLGVGMTAVGFAEFISKTAEAGEQLHFLSIKTGIAIDDLVGLDLAARMNGGSLEQFGMGVKKLSSYMFDAEKGTQANVDMLHILGVTAKEPLPALEQIADQFAKMPDGADKSAVAVKLFGKTGIDMIPMLNQGSEAFREMIEEGKKLNPVATEFSAKAVEFEDSMKKMQAASHGNAMILANEFLPVLTDVANEILVAGNNAKVFIDAGHAIGEVLKVVVVLAANTAYTFTEIGIGISGLAAQANALVHGNLAEVDLIQNALIEQGITARKEIDDFTAKILSSGKEIEAAEAAKPKTDNSVALKIKALADMRAAEAAAAAQEKLISDASIAQQVYDFNERTKLHAQYIKMVESYNPATKEMQRYQEELAAAAYYHTLSTSTTAGYNQMMEGIEQQHQDKMLQMAMKGQLDRDQFQSMSMMNQVSTVAGILQSSIGQAAQHNRVMFEINKQAAAANAIISTIQGATKALGDFPFPLNIAIAGIITAAGMINVAAIESSSFGGGSSASAPSASGGAGSLPGQTANPNVVAAPAAAQINQPASQFNLTLTGANHPNDPVYTYNNVVNDLMPILDKAYKNGNGNVNFNVVMA